MTRINPIVALRYWLLTVLLAVSGCSIPTERSSTIEQEQRESVVGQATTDVVDRTLTEPTPTRVTVPTEEGPITVEVQPTEHRDREVSTAASEDSDSAASGASASSVSIPWGIQLILVAIGCFMLMGVVSVLLRNRAAKAAYDVGTEYVTRMVNRVKSKAMAEGTTEVGVKMNALASEMGDDLADWQKD